jgi:GntR family transcriptional regulator/MocR family aminotransferase
VKKAYLQTALAAVTLEPGSPVSLYLQIYFAIREAILSGRLRSGSRLPSTRTMAADFGVSRNTVLVAHELLVAEGYITGRVGDGSYVSNDIPESLLHPEPDSDSSALPTFEPRLSKHATAVTRLRGPAPVVARAFSMGLPEVREFPREFWARALSRHARRASPETMLGNDPAGFESLREAVAEYLRSTRAVRCTADQVIIATGSQQALDLLARVLLEPGDEVCLEDPCYPGIQRLFAAVDARMVPVPVDAEGIDVQAGKRAGRNVRLIYVTPSLQFPLGITMSLPRRLALLDWATAANAVVLEDDYYSEFRYAGRPLSSLQGLDRAGRVAYVGSFSKVMFPGLRLGYLVVPEALIDPILAIRTQSDIFPPSITQLALADFMGDGHFSSHLRRMRALYAERQSILIDASKEYLADRLAIEPSDAGMHLVGALPSHVNDVALSRLAADKDVVALPLSTFYFGPGAGRQGLLLGYAGIPEQEIRSGAQRLAQAFDEHEADHAKS